MQQRILLPNMLVDTAYLNGCDGTRRESLTIRPSSSSVALEGSIADRLLRRLPPDPSTATQSARRLHNSDKLPVASAMVGS